MSNNYSSKFNKRNISIPDEQRYILKWLSPLACRERHQAVCDTRVCGGGRRLVTPQTKVLYIVHIKRPDGNVRHIPLRKSGCWQDIYQMRIILAPLVSVMLKRPYSPLIINTLNRIDGDSVAIAYVYYDFSTRNTRSASTVLRSVLSRDPKLGTEGV